MIPTSVPIRSEQAFRLAMRHRSAAETAGESYERLEFFGDSVLGLIIAEYLYQHYPHWDQGMLSKAKSSVVQETTLADVAVQICLDEHIELGSNELATGGRTRASILADAFEAVVGAVYLESGLEAARWFVLEQLSGHLERISAGDVSPHDHKSKLQEVAQANWRRTPVYRVVSESGASHEKEFRVQVLFDDEVMGEGTGRSKKDAEQAAAQEALDLIHRAQRAREIAFDRLE